MLIAANARLGRTVDDQPIGYSVLDLAGQVVTPFTRANVTRTFSGWWRVVGGVTVPDSGGFIRWGTERQPLAEEAVLPLPALDVTAITRRLDALTLGLQQTTAGAVGEMADRQAAVAELVAAQADDIAAIRQWCDLVAPVSRISTELEAMQSRLGRLVGATSQLPAAPVTEMAATERAQYESRIAALQSKLDAAVGAIDYTLDQLEKRGLNR